MKIILALKQDRFLFILFFTVFRSVSGYFPRHTFYYNTLYTNFVKGKLLNLVADPM